MALTGGGALVPGGTPGPFDWEIVRYEQARWALSALCLSKDPHLAWATLKYDVFTSNDSTSAVSHILNMANSDPPDHSRLRKLVAMSLTPGRVERMRPLIVGAAEGFADRLARGHAVDVDLVESFIFPLQATVTCDLLGIPARCRATFRSLAAGMQASDGESGLGDSCHEAYRAMGVLVAEVLAVKRDEVRVAISPDLQPDVLSALVVVRHDSERLSDQEVQAMAMLLISAGQQPTIDLIANGVATLLLHPTQLRLFREHPEMRAQGVEELLRYCVPVSPVPRIAPKDIEIDGILVHRGNVLAVDLVAAHGDPDQFDMPERFDIARRPNTHLAFGRGIHYCVGAPLARLQARVALTVLLTRFPGMTLLQRSDTTTGSPVGGTAALRVLPVALGSPADTGASVPQGRPV